jgi:signal transduction histidine kinase/CheY-like chemotaxis protein/HPt (histidine-containing phosphotransfer) domain-containing protein
MLYGLLRFIEGLFIDDGGHGATIVALCAILTIVLIIVQSLLGKSRMLPLITGIMIMAVFYLGALYMRDYDYYFISMLCVVGIVSTYQSFRSVLTFFAVSVVVCLPPFFTFFQDSSIADFRAMVIDGILFFYGFVFQIILSYRLTVRNTQAQDGQDAFASLLLTTPNMMVIVDGMRKVTYISEKMAAFADCPTVYAVGRPILDLFRDFELKLMFADIIDSEGFFEDVRKIDIAGEPHYFKIVCDRLHGGRDGIFIDVADITATVEAKNEAEVEKENAVRANESKSKFLATMSHEIRTPMNAIIGISQMQMGRNDLPADCVNALNKIYTAGHGLLSIINDILDLSKIETGKLELLPISYDLPSLINDAVQMNITRIGSKPIEFKLRVAEDVPAQLFGDELRLKQILNNLLSNAFKYTDEGSVTMNVIHERVDEKHIYLVISVADTGQGMKKEDAEALGNEFARFNMDANRSTEGTGLGMSITKRLINLMQGSLSIQSEYGVGSKFTVTVMQTVMSDKCIGPELAAKLRDFTFSRDREAQKLQIIREYMPYGRILVVDDVETNLYVAEGLLAPYGVKTETSMSGFDAIERVKNGEIYDIIFMDHMMPRMDGIEATTILRSMGYTAPIVALTANALAGNDVMFKSKGFDDFISKPIDIRQLNAAMNHYVRDRKKAESWIGDNSAPPPVQTQANAVSPKLIEVFLRDAVKAQDVLTGAVKANLPDIKLFTTTTHAMKSACANVGNNELSELAKQLEAAGRDNNRDYILANTRAFVQALTAFCETLKAGRQSENPEQEQPDNLPENTDLLKETLTAIAAACDDYDDSTAEKLLNSLKTHKWHADTNALLEDISGKLFHSEFEEAAELIQNKLNSRV